MFNPKDQQRARTAAVLTATVAAPWYRWDDARRDKLARELFAWQHAHLPVVARAAQRLGVTPETVRGWRDVPMLPVQVHKRVPGLSSSTVGRELRTAGTSGGPLGVVRISTEGCELALTASVSSVEEMIPDIRRRQLLAALPSPAHAPGNSVVLALAGLIERVGRPGSRFVADHLGVDVSSVAEAVRTSADGGEPILIAGATDGLLMLLDRLNGAGVRVEGHADVVLVHTGGRRAAPVDAEARLMAVAWQVLRIPSQRVLSAYHITEVATPYLDSSFRDGPLASRVKVAPPWVRVRAVDPFTLQPVAAGRVGLLAFCDLASLDRPFHALTDDLGFALPETASPETHFVVLGRSSPEELSSAGRFTDHIVAEQLVN